ncbi:hypothetical protein FACS1894190_14200 [Spirochaetia bacterium]|nr:hypothetical protein FACS1894190_14200 [Spirochaetia bacterium]
MTFEKAKQEIIRCSGIGIRRPCWVDKSLRITGDKQFAGARVVQKDKKDEAIIEIINDIQKKRETVYDGSDLFFQTEKQDYSDGGVYNGKSLKVGFGGVGLPYGKKDYLAKDWEIYVSENFT